VQQSGVVNAAFSLSFTRFHASGGEDNFRPAASWR
jgi:hypothetical protein